MNRAEILKHIDSCPGRKYRRRRMTRLELARLVRDGVMTQEDDDNYVQESTLKAMVRDGELRGGRTLTENQWAVGGGIECVNVYIEAWR